MAVGYIPVPRPSTLARFHLPYATTSRVARYQPVKNVTGRTLDARRSLHGERQDNSDPPPAEVSESPILRGKSRREVRQTSIWEKTPSKPRLVSASPTIEIVRKKLEQGHEKPTVLLKEYIDRNDARSEVVKLCLNAAYRKLQLLPRLQCRQTMRQQDPIASHCLRYLWSDSLRWIEAIEDHDCCKMLCYFSIGEGYEDLLIDWLKVVRPASGLAARTARDGREHQGWRGQLLRALMTAHTLPTHDHRADEALRCLFRVDQLLKDARADALELTKTIAEPAVAPVLFTSLWPSVVELSRALTSGKFHQTDSRLYEKFEDLSDAIGKKKLIEPDTLRYNRVRLRLHHPQRPSVAPALEFISDQFGSRSMSDAQARLPSSPKNLQSLQNFFTRVVQVAEQTGHSKDADRMREYASQLFMKELPNEVLRIQTHTSKSLFRRISGRS